jgi:hypothetical protein
MKGIQMQFGTVTNLCSGGFFVVRDQNSNCAAFGYTGIVRLKVGDVVQAELDKVGRMVMRHEERNEEFEVYAHTGESCLIACLLLIEKMRGYTDLEERVFKTLFSLPHAPASRRSRFRRQLLDAVSA